MMRLSVPLAPLAVLLALAGCQDAFGPDSTAPVVRITAPAEGTALEATHVQLSASATDDRRVVSAAVRVNGGPEQDISVSPGAEVPIELSIELAPGENVVSVLARDAAGNEGSAQVRITRRLPPDTTRPSISVPRDTIVTSAAFVLRGTLSDDRGVASAVYRLSGSSGEHPLPITPGRTVSFELPLEVAPAETRVEIMVRDSAGNVAGTVVKVWRRAELVSLQAGNLFGCMLTAAGETYCWRSERYLFRVGTPVPLQTLSLSAYLACGLGPAGEAYCWWDQPGDTVSLVPGGHTFRAVSTGAGRPGVGHACALTPSSEAYCWGSNQNGQLGGGTADTVSQVPVRVAGGHRFRAVAAGDGFTCALTGDGEPYCWGGAYGSTPRSIPGELRFDTIAAGTNRWRGLACGITAERVGYCWEPSRAPEPIEGGQRFLSLSLGSTHWCGVGDGNRAYCWGSNFRGQLGTGGGMEGSRLPAPVPGHEFSSISVGGGASYKYGTTCGITVGGTGYCWGSGLPAPYFNSYNRPPVPVS